MAWGYRFQRITNQMWCSNIEKGTAYCIICYYKSDYSKVIKTHYVIYICVAKIVRHIKFVSSLFNICFITKH